MASISLTDTHSRSNFFRQTTLLNLRYWHAWLGNKTADIATLDRERNRIIRGISFALDLGEAWPSVGELIVIFSPYMERRGHWDIWNGILNRAIKVARQIKDGANETTLSALLARLLFQQSCFKESVINYRRVIRLARQIGHSFNEARACSNLGYYYIEQGQWYRAEILCCHALQLFQQLGSNHGCAHTENHLGFLYTRQHRWEQARQHLERACAIWQSIEDDHGLMRGFLNLGGLYNDMEQPKEALIFLEKALHQAQLTGEEVISGRIYINISKACRLSGDLSEAKTYSKQAIAIFKQFSNLAELARAWNELGLVYFQQRRWQEAILHLENSLKAWQDLDNEVEEIEVLLDITECELIKGNQQEAGLRLKEAEYLIGRDQKGGRHYRFQPRLTKYRRSLLTDSSTSYDRSRMTG